MLQGFALSEEQQRSFRALDAGWSPGLARLRLRFPPEARGQAEQGLERAVQRHECLRTSFVRPPGAPHPFQVVGERSTLQVTWEDSGVIVEAPPQLLDAPSLLRLAAEMARPEAGEALQYVDYAAWQAERPSAESPSWRMDWLPEDGAAAVESRVVVPDSRGEREGSLGEVDPRWRVSGGPPADLGCGLGLYAQGSGCCQVEVLQPPDLPPGWAVLEAESHPQPFAFKATVLGDSIRARGVDATVVAMLLDRITGTQRRHPSPWQRILEQPAHLPAIRHKGETTTYGRLVEMARQLPPESGIALIRGPLDPERIAAILSAWMNERTVWLVPADMPAGRFETLQGLVTAEGGPAVLTFTSGTTGVPRALRVSHEALGHFLEWQGSTFEVGPGDRVAHATGLSFDVVYRELLLPLTRGACLCLPPTQPMEPGAWMDWLAEEGITRLHAVPTLGRWWVRHVHGSPCPGGSREGGLPPAPHARGRKLSLKTVFWAGEPLPRQLVLDWWELAPEAEMVNLYGPSETVLAKSYARFRNPAELPALDPLPVGWDLPESRTVVLADGEIGIMTPWRAMNPELFEEDGLYRTGDLGRRGPEGLEILGRKDDQVKIHGVRVSPLEVARTLGAETVLVTPEGLVAFHTGEESDLRERATHRLVPAARPVRYVRVDHLPVTPHGKLDRKALLATDPLEQELAVLVGEVLGLPTPTPDQTWQSLGAHSLQLLSLHGHLEARYGLELGLDALFQSPTVADLAQRLRRAEAAAPLPEPGFQLSSIQEALWLSSQLDPAAYNEPLAMRLDGPLDVERLRACVRALGERHEGLRSAFPARDGRPYLEIQEAHLELEERDDPPDAVAAEAMRPFDLNRAPLLRLTLVRERGGDPLRAPSSIRGPQRVREGADRHWLVGAVHHLVFDAWSRWRFWGDLMDAYAGEKAADSLPYRHFAARQKARWRPASLDYWTERLRGCQPLPSPESSETLTEGRLDRDEVERMATAAGVTPFQLLATAFARALAERTGHSDLVLGTPVAHRPPGFERTLGCFLNLVPLRFRLDGCSDLRQAARSMRPCLLEDFAHQDAPFEKIVERLAPPRTESRTPLVDAVINLVNVPYWGEPQSRGGLTWTADELAPRTPRFAYTLYVRGDRLRLVGGDAGLLERFQELLRPAAWGPLPNAVRPAPAPTAVEESDPALQVYVQELFSDLLERPVTGDVSFFSAGGHSLMASEAVARMRAGLAQDVPLRLLFQHQTPRALAARLEKPRRLWSEAQKGLLRRMREYPGAEHWNIPRAVCWRGPLQPERLEAAWEQMCERHALHRGLFGEVPRPRLEWSGGDRPFRLHAEAPFRLQVLRQGPEEHILLACAHHLAADCWAMGIAGCDGDWLPGRFFPELWQAYHGQPLGDPPLAPEAFAAWQADFLSSAEGRLQRDWWRDRLAGSKPYPTGKPRPERWTFQGARPTFRLPRAGEGHYDLLAAYLGMLGETDVVVAVPVANRNLPGSTASLGWFSNTLPMRFQMPDPHDLPAVREEVKRVWFEALAYQEFPLEAMPNVPELRVRFLYHRASAAVFEQDGLRMEPLRRERAHAKQDLTLWCMEGPRAVSGWLEYCTDLFTAEEIQQRIARLGAVPV